jgi:hypothetical protein
MSDAQEHQWLARMERALADAREWEIWAEELHLPEPRSALFYDDQLCPTFPTSTSAYHGISAAIDHVNLICDAIQGRQATRPYAYFPPARAATFAAARSVWILSPPTRKKRQVNGLWMEWDNNRKQRNFVESVRADDPKVRVMVDGYLAKLDDLKQRVVDAGDAVGQRLSNSNKPPSDTHIMEFATTWLDRHADPSEYGSGHAAMLLWRQHSGAAHSLPWINTGRVEVMERLEEGGVKGRVTASYADIGMAVASAVLMISEALKLYTKRTTAPPRSRRP